MFQICITNHRWKKQSKLSYALNFRSNEIAPLLIPHSPHSLKTRTRMKKNQTAKSNNTWLQVAPIFNKTRRGISEDGLTFAMVADDDELHIPRQSKSRRVQWEHDFRDGGLQELLFLHLVTIFIIFLYLYCPLLRMDVSMYELILFYFVNHKLIEHKRH